MTTRTIRGLKDGQIVETQVPALTPEQLAAAAARRAEREAASRPPLSGLDFLQRLTIQEYAAIIAASQANAQLSLWIDMLRVNGTIRLQGEDAQAAKAALVAGRLLTQVRADVIFA
jgi:hypothetical protein